MAITNEIQQDIIALVVGMFDAAPGQAVLEDLAQAKLSGMSDAALANHLASTPEFRSIYPTILTNQQFAARLVDNMAGGLLAPADRQWAIDALTASLNGGATRGETALEAINALRAVEPSNTAFYDAKVAFDNKVEVATYFSIELNKNGDSLAELQAVLAGVDETPESVIAAKEAADGIGQPEPGDVFLTVGNDVVSGTGAADTFIADVNQNPLGQQVNTLGTGDRLNGGAGTDVLEAQVTRGATFGDSNMAIQPRTTSVENVFIEAINADLPNAGGNTNFPDENTQVYVNAEDMTSLEQFWSNSSDADLIVQNLTTRTDGGVLRNTSEVAIGMAYTSADDTNWQESDLHVYFADNNLISDVETSIIGSQANYWLLDQDSEEVGLDPLENIDRDGIRFTLDGVAHLVRPAGEALLDAGTWENYAQILRDELALLVNGGATQLAGIEVVVDYDNIVQTFNDAGELVSIPAITLIDNNGGVFSDLGFTIPEEISGDFNVFGRTNTLPPTIDTSAYVTSTIFLEKVGRGGDGGELVVGGMSKNGENEWDGVQGVEQFNVNVIGDEDLPSSLSGLRSTNNQLQIVNIASVAGGNASLVIGNDGSGLKDVQIVNAAEMNGDLFIEAELTTESIAKYFDLNDAQGDAAMDDIFFDYNLTGSGDNGLDLDVSQEIASHDDFVLTVLTGEGDDYVEVSLDNNNGSLNTNWYEDQSALANVSIATGAGDDIVWTPGSGDVIISTGSGNDVVYTDDSGDESAIWITNAVDLDINDILGAGTVDSYFLWNSTLTVTYSGPSVNSAGGVTTGDADDSNNGWESTVTIPTNAMNVANHSHINQAIKDAINNDPVLSAVLEAEDGPNFSLIIRSRVDGEVVADDLTITVAGPTAASITALSAGAQSTLLATYNDFINDSDNTFGDNAAFAAAINGEVADVAAAYQGINGSTLASSTPYLLGVPGTDEVQTIDFAGLTVDVGGTLTVGGVVVNVVAADDDEAIALAVQTAINGQILAGTTVAATATVDGTVVTITFDQADGDVADVVVADGTATFTVDSPAIAEEQEIDFNGAGPVTATGNLDVGGILVNLTNGDTDVIIAEKVAAAINGQQLSDPLGNVTATAAAGIVTVVFETTDGDVDPIGIDNLPGSATFGGILPAAGVETVAFVDAGPVPATVAGEAVVDEVTVGVEEDAAVGYTPITGEDSEAETDNTVNLGSDDDVVVLSTSAEANETLVWTGLNNGVNSIINFSVDGPSADVLDFTAYLPNMTSASGSTSSAVDIATAVQIGTGAVTASEVVVTTFASLNAATGINWANLTAATLASTLNAAVNNGVWTVAATPGLQGPTGTVQKAVFMIENGANDGEYKIFEVSMANTTSNTGFTGVGLIGVADFGDSLDGITNANFVA